MSHMGTGYQDFGLSSVAFLGHKHEWVVEKPRQEMTPIWDPRNIRGRISHLSHYTRPSPNILKWIDNAKGFHFNISVLS